MLHQGRYPRVTQRTLKEGPGAPAAAPPRPQVADRPSGWTGGRITALVTGVGGGLLIAGAIRGRRASRANAGQIATNDYEGRSHAER
jgi:hypothetical protein